MPSVFIDQPEEGDRLTTPTYDVKGYKAPKHAQIILYVHESKNGVTTTTQYHAVSEPTPGEWLQTIPVTVGCKYLIAAHNGTADSSVECHS